MDDRRFEELERKKVKEGLTRDEADELGRMYAEKMGEPYSNADQRPPPDAIFRAKEEKPVTEDQVEEFTEQRGQQSEEE